MFTLWRLDGDKKVKVNRNTGVATITMEEGKTLTKETVEKLFKDSDYQLTEFKHIKGPDLETEGVSYSATIESEDPEKPADIIIEKLIKLETVESAVLDEDGTQVVITMKPGQTLSKESVDAALKDSGFSCTALKEAEPEDAEAEPEAEDE